MSPLPRPPNQNMVVQELELASLFLRIMRLAILLYCHRQSLSYHEKRLCFL